jgi:protein dpy-30
MKNFRFSFTLLQKKEAIEIQKTLNSDINLQTASDRIYLEETIVPLLVQGLACLAKERPPNPTEYLAAFLLKNNSEN